MASYIYMYMQNLNKISQILFSILYGKINKHKLNITFLYAGRQHNSFNHGEFKVSLNQLQPYAKFELNLSTYF